MSVTRRLAYVACTVVFGGLVWGLWPVHHGGTDCGTGLMGAPPVGEAQSQADKVGLRYGVFVPDEDPGCVGTRGTARTVSLALIGLGVAVGVAGWVTAGAARRPARR